MSEHRDGLDGWTEILHPEKRSTAGTPLQYVRKFTFHDAITQCTSYARGETLLSFCPKLDGRAAYVWRMVRFFAGIDTRMPIGAFFKLADEIHDACGVELSLGILGDMENAMIRHLDGIAERLIAHLGLDQYGAARAWSMTLTGKELPRNLPDALLMVRELEDEEPACRVLTDEPLNAGSEYSSEDEELTVRELED